MTQDEQLKAIKTLQTQVKKLQAKHPFISLGKKQTQPKPSNQKTVIAN